VHAPAAHDEALRDAHDGPGARAHEGPAGPAEAHREAREDRGARAHEGPGAQHLVLR